MQYRYYCKDCDWEMIVDDASEGAKEGDAHMRDNPSHQTAMQPQ
jgi:hypothetical protein